MSRQITLLAVNPNNWYNKGDLANRLGLVKALRKEFGSNVRIILETLTPREDKQYFKKYGVEVVESIFYLDHANKLSYALRVAKTAKNTLLLLFSLITYRIFKTGIDLRSNEQTYSRYLVDSDLIISSPGGFLQDYNIFSSLIPNLFLIFLSKVLQKPVVVYAQSIGPFRNVILRALCRFVLNRIDVIILREAISKKYLEEADISRPRAFITADATFSIEPPQYPRARYREKFLKFTSCEEGRTLVGVTVLGNYFLSRKRHGLLKRYVKSLAAAIDYMVDKLNATAVFIPQVSVQSEKEIAYLVAGLVKNKNRVVIIDEDLPLGELMKYIGSMDLFVGTRMHSNIFALIMNVPVVAIAYEHKTHGIMKMLSLENWVLDIEKINEHELISKIDELYNRRFEIKKYLSKRVEEMRAMSLYTAEIIRNWYVSEYGLKDSSKLHSSNCGV